MSSDVKKTIYTEADGRTRLAQSPLNFKALAKALAELEKSRAHAFLNPNYDLIQPLPSEESDIPDENGKILGLSEDSNAFNT